MKGYRLTVDAVADLDEIAEYIARDNPRAAQRLLDILEKQCNRLVKYPALGMRRPELHPDVRSITEGNYVLFYREIKDHIEVLRVLHAARDISPDYFH